MQAITLPSYGDPDVLTLAELDDPVPGPGEVLLDVAATAVNRADLMQRHGLYPPPPGAPAHPGLECSGTVAALGDGVAGWQVGDRVCALLSGGGYAERVAVPAGQLLPVPAGLSLVEAAALPEVACTVWSNVFQLAALQPGEVLLVHGGASGIGTMAVQLGAHAGRAGDRHRRLGGQGRAGARARRGARGRATATRTSCRSSASTAGGADVVLDVMGAAYLARNVDVLADGGRLVVIGLQGGARAELDLGALLAKRGSVAATALRSRTAGAEGRHRRGRARRGLAGRRGGRGAAGRRPGAAAGAGRRGAPGRGGVRARGQGRAAGLMSTPRQPGRRRRGRRRPDRLPRRARRRQPARARRLPPAARRRRRRRGARAGLLRAAAPVRAAAAGRGRGRGGGRAGAAQRDRAAARAGGGPVRRERPAAAGRGLVIPGHRGSRSGLCSPARALDEETP